MIYLKPELELKDGEKEHFTWVYSIEYLTKIQPTEEAFLSIFK